jgi:hypothetical protein
MKKQAHPDFIKSSNLIFMSIGIGLINFLYVYNVFIDVKNIVIIALTYLLLAVIGYLVRQGKVWIKYLLLIIIVLGVSEAPVIIQNLFEKPLLGVLIIPQTVLQVWALIMLFKLPLTTDHNNKTTT